MSDQVRSKHFRERAYEVVDEMCERVFDDTDREKTTECEAEWGKRTLRKRDGLRENTFGGRQRESGVQKDALV